MMNGLKAQLASTEQQVVVIGLALQQGVTRGV
jgi:hypothetical protein